MKKTVLLLAFLVASSATFAQVKIRPGVKLGLNNSRIQGFDNTDSKIGINGGLFVNFDFTSFYELQLETTYSEQGATFTVPSLSQFNDPLINNQIIEQDIDLQYVSLAIANKFFIVKDLGLHLIIGPSIDVKVNDTFNDAPIDLSFFGGIGYEFPFGLAIEARYKQGIIDLDDGFTTFGGSNNDDSLFIDRNYLNSVIQVGAAYKFDF